MSVRIFVDSTADMAAARKQQVTVVPLTVHFGEKEFVDGVDLSAGQFYEMLAACETLPTTSQPTPFTFEEAFGEAVAAGDSVVCVTISSRLSGTCQSARIAAEEFPGKVFVVDSQNVTIGAGVLASYAVALRDRGLSAEEIALELEAGREKVRMIAMLDTLEYLKKGGRISAAAALAGGLLNIKPLLHMECGELKMAGKARGMKQAALQLGELIRKSGGIDPERPLLLGYTGLEDTLLRRYIADNPEQWPEENPDTTVVGSVVGTHAGPGAIAVGFFARD